MNDPTFSVIIPNYNNGATLARAIDSVLAQSVHAREIIVIDDGSRDESRAVAAAYGERVRYIYQENAGVSAARNHGARVATGDWLAFLDADDVYLPQRLALHADWLRREPDLDFLFGDQEYRSATGEFLQMAIDGSAFGRLLAGRHPEQTEWPISAADFEGLIADGFSEIRTLSLPRAAFMRLGGFPLDHKIGEDLYFFIRLFRDSKKGGVVNAPLAIYYIYPNSALRKDVVGAQTAFIAALLALAGQLVGAPAPIRRGWRAKLRQGHLSLAYMHLRAGRSTKAFGAVLPLLWRDPSLRSLRDLASIARGMPKGAA